MAPPTPTFTPATTRVSTWIVLVPTPSSPTADNNATNTAFIILEACGLLPPRSDEKTYAAMIQKAQAEMDQVQADMRQLQAEMRQSQACHREEIVRFRRDIAALAAQVSRGVQLGHARALRTEMEMRLHAVLTRECDLQEEVDVLLVQRMREVGARTGELGARDTDVDTLWGKDGERGTVEAMVRAMREMTTLKREKERKGRELERVVKVRVGAEREIEALGGGGCYWCEEKMCERCMEVLTVCGECEEMGMAWEEVVAAAARK